MSGIEQRAIAAYLGLAVGDALGATVEFMTPREIDHKHGVHREIIGGGWLRLKPGMVTDDTTMSLALGDALLEAGGIDAQTIGRHFDQWMRNKPVDIGNTVRRGVLNFRNKGETRVPPNEHDGGNGACMRVLPVAIATLGSEEQAIREAAETQSHITHNNPLSDAGTWCVVRMLQMAMQGTTLAQLRQGPVEELLQLHPEFIYRRKQRTENPSGFIVHTLHAVFSALFDTDNFEDCLIDVVNRGGDADTTGAIAGMIAGALYGLESIPERWLKKLAGEIPERCRVQAGALLKQARLTA